MGEAIVDAPRYRLEQASVGRSIGLRAAICGRSAALWELGEPFVASSAAWKHYRARHGEIARGRAGSIRHAASATRTQNIWSRRSESMAARIIRLVCARRPEFLARAES